MYRKLLAVAICTVLAAPAWAHDNNNTLNLSVADAAQQTTTQQTTDDQNTQDQDQNEKATKLKTITVTGSLIPRSQIETSTPTIQITNEEIKRQGFATVADALHALPQATGSVQGAQFSGGFTQGAQTISLLGLDPGFTLFLIDGKPMADYPLLYNGSGNFVDISNIPMAMVDHIDIVPGNQSAIYGSSAIAGVVNIVLKQHVEGFTMDIRGGGFSEGGGGSQRLQLTGGHDWDKAHLTYSLEFSHQQPIYRYQRSQMDSNNDSPTWKPGQYRGAFDYMLQDLFYNQIGTDRFFIPGGDKARCASVAAGYNNTVRYFKDYAGRGSACGSAYEPGYQTMMNGSKSATGYLNFNYDIGATSQLYANVLYNVRNVTYDTGAPWWGSSSDFGPIYAANVDNGTMADGPGTFIATQYVLDNSIAGIGKLANQKDLNRSYVANVGIRGSFGESDWTYDAYYHRSDYVTLTRQLHFVADKVDQYFLGDPIAATDPVLGAYPVYNLDLDKFYTIMQPDTYRSLSEQIRTKSHTYTQEVSGVVTNSNLFDLPGGSAGIAMLLQYGNQKWQNPTDPKLIEGYFWGRTGTRGEGKRDRYAGAVEMTLPVATWLTADVSARYDSYKASGRKDSKLTYKVGLEWRPIDTLLIRGTYATAFRAPDMAGLYQQPSGFYTYVVDYYRCREAMGDKFDVNSCPYNNEQVSGTQQGNLDLKNITAKSWTGGIVWSPTSNFNIHADFYKVKIDNEVSQRSLSGILQLEADCLIGHNKGGSAVDISSARCQEALSLVDRNTDPSNPLQSGISAIHTYPINISSEMVKGVTSGLRYRLDAGAAGDFVFGADYNVVLDHTYQQYPEDPVIDALSLAYLGEFKSRTSANVTWMKNRWTITLYGIHDGTMANYDEDGRLPSWTTYNASVTYQALDNVKLSLISNNVTNERPPYDSTHTAYPFYNVFSYNAYGRSIFAELTWKFF